ncbi:Hypp5293 [Branchiostoma lanceolatum]|uniref:Hypp5293 protein n=1 Tax=Branchiostoma lanceolatum TaxID=7740 RepID=A0A8K0F3X5_BRALA|nr:Hypp5293 [Branchiostoma lanceolatum]
MELPWIHAFLLGLALTYVKAATKDINMGFYCTHPGNRVDVSDSDAGELVWDSYPSSEDCTVTLVAAVGKRIFLQFTDISISGDYNPCTDVLFVKGGSYGGGIRPDASWETVCGWSHPDFDAHNRHVTLKLKTNQYGTGHIHIRYTVYHSAHYDGCGDYKCLGSDMCIDNSLLCDGVDHCGDNSDEEHREFGGCGVVRHREWMKKIGIIVGCVVGVLLLIIVIICIYRRKKRPAATRSDVPMATAAQTANRGPTQMPGAGSYSPPPSYDEVVKSSPNSKDSGNAVV